MTNLFDDQNLVCSECGNDFLFSERDQEFFAQKGYSQPKRCPSCRAKRNAGGDSRGGNGMRRGPRSGGFASKPRTEVICSACGTQTTVPFEPRSGEPVYCSACYKSRKG